MNRTGWRKIDKSKETMQFFTSEKNKESTKMLKYYIQFLAVTIHLKINTFVLTNVEFCKCLPIMSVKEIKCEENFWTHLITDKFYVNVKLFSFPVVTWNSVTLQPWWCKICRMCLFNRKGVKHSVWVSVCTDATRKYDEQKN